MTNDELNYYIKHYIEKDKTGRAIMLTGAWGTGKSYYIKNNLIPFLSKPENGNHQSIVVSLYGLSSLSEISKAIYMEARLKKIRPESEAGKSTLLIAKTVIKGAASYFGIDLNAKAEDLQALYESIDLSGKLIIIEDVERTRIDIRDLLGYVNSLAEQDNVKVLLVTNEKEIIKYKPVEKERQNESSSADWFAELSNSTERSEEKEYSDSTKNYIETKEKSIGDTINFTGDLKNAIQEIILSFDNHILKQFATEKDAEDIVDIMYLMRSENLRSIIFACQKSADVYEQLSDDSLSEDFLRTILFGTVAFSLRMHAGFNNKWIGLEQYSQELGIRKYPLFRFCYDYILTQKMDPALVPMAIVAFDKLRLYDRDKTSTDQELQKFYNYHLLSEEEVIKVAERVMFRLTDPTDIAFHDYAKIAVTLIKLRYVLGIDIDKAKESLVNNLHGRGDSISADDLFWYILDEGSPEEQEEFIALREEMINSLNDSENFIPGFDYLPEHAETLYEYTINNLGTFYNSRGFANSLDIPELIKMFTLCTAAQMDYIRAAFNAVYRPININDILAKDLPAIEELIAGINEAKDSSDADKIQLLQYKWFTDVLIDIKRKLSTT